VAQAASETEGKKMITLGIDPGVTGAWAALSKDGELIQMGDMPIMQDGRIKWVDGEALWEIVQELKALDSDKTIYALTERIVPLPQNGRLGAFSQGCTLGSLLAALQVLGCRIELIMPSEWKKHYNLGADKKASVNKARLLYPTATFVRAKDHNRAEALLIAHFAFTQRAIWL
jgi:crossover junction endodeoxyribonuclease RuvC